MAVTTLGLGQIEHRGASSSSTNYTDILVSALLQQSRGETISARALGSQEIAAGIISRALSLATIDGAGGLLTTRLVAEMARDLIVNGEALYKLDVDLDGRVRLLRSTSYSVYGSDPDPATWRYNLSLYGPTQSRMIDATAAEVLHVRYATLTGYPWRGLSPLRLAAATGALSARLTETLGHEAAVAVARVIPMPQGQSVAVSGAIQKLLTDPESGRIVLPETTKAGGGAGMGSAPQRDYRAERLGFDAPASEEALYRVLLVEVGAICGVPWPLMPGSGSAGPGIREAQRELLTGTIQPLGDLIVEEAARVFEAPVTITHHKLAAADVAARARGVHILTQAGIDAERALELVGWAS